MMRAFQDKYGVQVIHAWGMTEMSPVGTAAILKSKHLARAARRALRGAEHAGPRGLRRRHEDRR